MKLGLQTLYVSLIGLTLALGCRPDDLATEDKEDSASDHYRLSAYLPLLPHTLESHLPPCDDVLTVDELPIRLFADDGHTFYFEVTAQAALAGDTQACKEDPLPSNTECPNSATNIRIVPWGATYCADTGKVELDLRGGKNFRPWLGIPTLKLDTGEFGDKAFTEGDSQLRFHSGQGGATVLREAIALRIWRALDYPTPRSSFVKTQSNVWDTALGPGIWATHLMLQSYKKKFFDEHLPQTVSVWEGKGDPFEDGWTEVDCEWSAEEACDNAQLDSLVSAVRAETHGPGFQERTSSFIDWKSVHAFRCLSTITGASDDWIHTGRNVVLALSEDGRASYLPRGLDRSAGLNAHADTSASLHEAMLVRGCSEDPECDSDYVNACGSLLDSFDSLDLLTTIVDERCETLQALGLDRPGDQAACAELHDFYADTVARVRSQLEQSSHASRVRD